MAPDTAKSDSSIQRVRYRSEFEKLLTSLSTRFINLPVEAIDDSVTEAIGKVGSYIDVDRGFVYMFGEGDPPLVSLVYEWCAPGAASLQDRSEPIDVAPLAWTVARFRAGEIVHVPNVRALPVNSNGTRQSYEAQGIRSIIKLPMFMRSELVGCLGFSCLHKEKTWSDDDIALLRVVGEIVVNAWDRKQADRRLRESEERYRSVVEDQTDFIVRWRPDGTRTFVNGAVCRFYGKTRDELLQESVFDFIHEQSRPALREKLSQLSPAQPTATAELCILHPDGRLLWQEWTDRAVFDASGEVVEYQSVGRDITLQKQAREELQYRQRLENLLLNLTTRFINLPPDRLDDEISAALRQVGEFTGIDRSYIYLMDAELTEATLAYEWVAAGCPPTPPELQRIPLEQHQWGIVPLQQGETLMLSSLDDLPASAEELRDAILRINVQSFVIVPIFFQQRLFGMLGFSSSQHGQQWSQESMALLRLIGEVFLNAMDRQRAQRQLAMSEERLSLTVEAVADGFYDWNIETGNVYVSDNWLRVLGLPADNSVHQPDFWLSLVHPDDRLAVETRVQEHLAGNADVYECELRVRLRGGEWRWCHDRGRVIARDDQGRPLRMVGIIRDITEDVQNRERLRETETQLAHLARVATMGEIVAGIAHEVNQPLHAAATFATATIAALESEEPEGPARAVGMVRKISAQMTRAADIIRRLRDFTRPRPAQLELFDVNRLVRESAELLAYESGRRKIAVAFELDPALPHVMGDRVQIQQVLVNLLRNAYESIAQSAPVQPQVRVVGRKVEHGVRLDIIDNGVGLPTGHAAEELFDTFFTTKSEGMGMGLALCRTIVDAHHGRVWGEVNELGGMTFSIILPLRPNNHSR